MTTGCLQFANLLVSQAICRHLHSSALSDQRLEHLHSRVRVFLQLVNDVTKLWSEESLANAWGNRLFYCSNLMKAEYNGDYLNALLKMEHTNSLGPLLPAWAFTYLLHGGDSKQVTRVSH